MMAMHGVGADCFRPRAPALRHTAARFSVRALSADAALLESLPSSPRRGHVHSVFERVINIDVGGGRLITLAHRDSDDAPDTVVVDLGSWAAPHLVPGIEARLSDRWTVLGDDVFISLEQAASWHGRLPAYARDDAILRANLPAARDHVERRGQGIGPRRSAGVASTPLDTAAASTFRRGTRGLCEAIARNNASLAHEYIGRLVGLGPGLTPSGDDFLLGLLAVLSLPSSPCHGWRCIGDRVVECAETQTHLISAAALRHAANGRVRASVIGLCDALMHEPSTTMLGALERVMHIGSSSGTEIALGVLAGFRLHLGCAEAPPMTLEKSERSGVIDGS